MEWLTHIPDERIYELNSFDLFGLPVKLDLDEGLFEKRYIQLTQWAHPDRNSDRPEWALLVSARINQAYDELSKFRTRAEIFLKISRPLNEYEDRSMPSDFLEKVFLWNEMHEEGILEMEIVEDAYEKTIEDLLSHSRKQDWSTEQFKQLLNQMKYMENLLKAEEP